MQPSLFDQIAEVIILVLLVEIVVLAGFAVWAAYKEIVRE